MRLARFYVPSLAADELVLEGDEHTHLARALRAKPGQEVEAFDGAGGSARCVVEEVGRRASRLRVEVRSQAQAEAGPQIVCLLATPKGKRPQRMIEAVTELGASRVVPLVSARSSGSPFAPEKARRWALEACKQCRRDLAPTCEDPLTLAQVAERAGDALVVFCDTGSAPPVAQALPPAAPDEVWVVVGPEGGFSEEERELLRACATPVSLGPRILRIETAAVAILSALHTVWGA